jgi:glutathionylspermidine synthase
MERIVQIERDGRAQKLEAQGLSYHSWDDYWNEGVAYKFTANQVDELEAATNELHDMCKQAVRHVVANRRYEEFGIDRRYQLAIERSLEHQGWSLYGRFDLAYDGVNPPKMLEYNADTPTSILESAVCQWYWLEDVHPQADQFNSIHERLVSRWKQNPYLSAKTIHFASIKDNEEDWVCVHYLMDTAAQAGFNVKHVYVQDLGYNSETQCFVDLENQDINLLFKLYPWEWMLREEFGEFAATCHTRFIEPMWKSILSCKAILPVLWELYPGHPNLLPAYFSPDKLNGNYAKKPLFSREGANIELYRNNVLEVSDTGPYGAEGYVYQQLVDLPNFNGNYPIIGSWVIGEESAGICIREDSLKITTNMSHFIPHYFD